MPLWLWGACVSQIHVLANTSVAWHPSAHLHFPPSMLVSSARLQGGAGRGQVARGHAALVAQQPAPRHTNFVNKLRGKETLPPPPPPPQSSLSTKNEPDPPGTADRGRHTVTQSTRVVAAGDATHHGTTRRRPRPSAVSIIEPHGPSSQAQGTVKGRREAVDSASNTDHDAALALALADSGAKGSLRLLSLQKPQEDGRGQDLPQPLIGAEQLRQLLLVDGIWCPWAE
jgi:hypothetical protein